MSNLNTKCLLVLIPSLLLSSKMVRVGKWLHFDSLFGHLFPMLFLCILLLFHFPTIASPNLIGPDIPTTCSWGGIQLVLAKLFLQSECQGELYKELVRNYNSLERPVASDLQQLTIYFSLSLLQIMDFLTLLEWSLCWLAWVWFSIHCDNLCLLIGALRPVTFKMISIFITVFYLLLLLFVPIFVFHLFLPLVV